MQMDCDLAPYLSRWAGCWLWVGLMWITVVMSSATPPCCVSTLTWATVMLWHCCSTTELRLKSFFLVFRDWCYNIFNTWLYANIVFGCNWKIVFTATALNASCVAFLGGCAVTWRFDCAGIRCCSWTSWHRHHVESAHGEGRCLPFALLDFLALKILSHYVIVLRRHYTLFRDFTSGLSRFFTNKNTWH